MKMFFLLQSLWPLFLCKSKSIVDYMGMKDKRKLNLPIGHRGY